MYHPLDSAVLGYNKHSHFLGLDEGLVWVACTAFTRSVAGLVLHAAGSNYLDHTLEDFFTNSLRHNLL